MLPANKKAKEAFVYYRDGMSAQADGEYAEALDNYYEALTLEEDPNDRSYILYNIGISSIVTSEQVNHANSRHQDGNQHHQTCQ